MEDAHTYFLCKMCIHAMLFLIWHQNTSPISSPTLYTLTLVILYPLSRIPAQNSPVICNFPDSQFPTST